MTNRSAYVAFRHTIPRRKFTLTSKDLFCDILDTDASNLAISSVLSEKVNREKRVVAYASRNLSKAEVNYCVTRKELLVVVYFTKCFKHYLLGAQIYHPNRSRGPTVVAPYT